MTKASVGIDFDTWMNSGSDWARSSGFAEGWKSDEKQGNDGVCRKKFWLHSVTWAAKCWNHPVPHVIEITDKTTQEKTLAVRNQRFGCHESEALLMKRYDRTRSGAREQPPTTCPECILAEVVMELVDKGTLSWTDPVFQWDGDGGDEPHVVLAGGLYNAFGSKEVERDRALLKELKAAGVNRKEAWTQSQLVRLQWVFCVIDPENLDSGVQITLESKSLGDAMKTAIKDEMRKAAAGPKRDKDWGDPTKHPYPFEWSFDNSKEFAAKYHVIALRDEEPNDRVLELIRNGALPDDLEKVLEPGSCWELKANLEAHVVKGVDLPWDRIFGPAERAGLMVPPEDSKADAAEDGGGKEVGRGAAQTKKGPTLEVYVVGPEHDVWFDDAKPDPKVKGKRVHLEAPEGDGHDDNPATPEEIKAARALLTKWGAAEVGLLMLCDHCDGQMTDLDMECPVCGAQYDEAGTFTGRPCLAGCGGSVPVGDGKPGNYICEKCAAIHTLVEGTADLFGAACWKMQAPPPPKEEKKPEANGRRRRLAAEPEPPKEEPKPAMRTRRQGGVPFDKAAK